MRSLLVSSGMVNVRSFRIGENARQVPRYVTTWQDALDAIAGRPYTLDGVHGKISVEYRSRSGYVEHRVWHRASDIGRMSPAYRAMRAQLGDHYDTDLTLSERLATEIMPDLGVVWS